MFSLPYRSSSHVFLFLNPFHFPSFLVSFQIVFSLLFPFSSHSKCSSHFVYVLSSFQAFVLFIIPISIHSRFSSLPHSTSFFISSSPSFLPLFSFHVFLFLVCFFSLLQFFSHPESFFISALIVLFISDFIRFIQSFASSLYAFFLHFRSSTPPLFLSFCFSFSYFLTPFLINSMFSPRFLILCFSTLEFLPSFFSFVPSFLLFLYHVIFNFRLKFFVLLAPLQLSFDLYYFLNLTDFEITSYLFVCSFNIHSRKCISLKKFAP